VVIGGSPKDIFAVGSVSMVEQPEYVTGVLGTDVNVGVGEALGVATGVDGEQEVRMKKVKSKKRKGKSFLVCISSPS